MDKRIVWLKMAYWTAAIADFIVAALVLIPSRMGVTQYVYPMGLMSVVAFSWGVALLIAARRPVERRWFLPPTMIVVALLGAVGLHAGITGLLPVSRVIPVVISSIIILSIQMYSYRITHDFEPKNRTL